MGLETCWCINDKSVWFPLIVEYVTLPPPLSRNPFLWLLILMLWVSGLSLQIIISGGKSLYYNHFIIMTYLPCFWIQNDDVYIIFQHVMVLCVFICSSQVCMLCSVGYHLFSCHRSERTCRRWLALDYAGISVGILGCYVPGIFYAFYCNAVSVNRYARMTQLACWLLRVLSLLLSN